MGSSCIFEFQCQRTHPSYNRYLQIMETGYHRTLFFLAQPHRSLQNILTTLTILPSPRPLKNLQIVFWHMFNAVNIYYDDKNYIYEYDEILPDPDWQYSPASSPHLWHPTGMKSATSQSFPSFIHLQPPFAANSATQASQSTSVEKSGRIWMPLYLTIH